MIRVIDVFSGIGGFSLGLESTGGFETVAFCEIEPFPREVLAVHWPEVPCFTDVRELKLSPGDADMIVGGFPCQDISVAGKGAGIEGERSGLWRELFRLVQECRPRWVLVENVSALRTRGADRVLSDLEAEGYACWPLVVGAWAVGAPHRRERVWIVAHRSERRRDAQSRRGASASARNCTVDADSSGASDRLSGAQRPDQEGNSEESHHSGGGSELPESEGERRPEQGYGRNARSRLGCDGPRWPARPGEPQHEWEESRLAFAGSTDAAGRTSLGGRRGRTSNAQGHGTGAGDVSRSPQQPLGGPTARLLEQLVRCVVVTDGKTGQAGPAEVLRLVQSLTDEEAFQRAARRPLSVSGATLLRLAMHGGRQGNGRARSRNAALTDSAGDSAQAVLRAMSLDARTTAASQEPGQDGQPSRERADAVRVLPRERPLEEREAQILLDYLMNERLARRANRESLKALGNSVVPQVVAAIGRAILAVERG